MARPKKARHIFLRMACGDSRSLLVQRDFVFTIPIISLVPICLLGNTAAKSVSFISSQNTSQGITIKKCF